MIDEEVKNYKEIYQRIKKENPCVFCVRSAGGCRFKGNKCDSTSLKKYYERNHLEIESILKDIYIKELEKENEQLKQEKLKQENEQLKNTITQLRKQINKMKNCSNCNGIIKGGMRTERCEFCIKDKDFRYWELAE